MDLREPAVAAFRAGSSCRAVGERFGVAESSVVKWSQREATTGSVAPGKVGGHRKPVLAPHHDRLMERVAQTPDVTLTALRCNLAAQGVNVSLDTIWRYLRAAGLSFKKKARWLRNRTARMSHASG